MPLCNICKSIPFEDLPPFPDEEYMRGLTGLEYVHRLARHRDTPRDPTVTRVRHHGSIEHLRQAAADGCELCLLIQGEADAMTTELESTEGSVRQIDGPPTFDMWLTKRPDGGQGFWVLCECGSSGRVVVPVAAFAFIVEEDNALAGVFRGRPVKQDPDSQTLQRLVRWNGECDRNHECYRYQCTGPMPSHLIDVRSYESVDTVKLVEMDIEARQRYIALSYLSEPGITSYWESDARPEDGRILLEGLPKMFQDAVLVTRALGIQYLWISSLCVSTLEWERDSEQAGLVYSNAYLNISATGSKSTADGLFLHRPSRIYLQVPYRANDDGATGTILLSTLPLAKEVIRSRYIEMEKEPISSGVWSFQERVLSSRIIHFASDQMYFECPSHFISEDGLLEHMRFPTILEKLPDGVHHIRGRSGKTDGFTRWYSLLWHYGQRQPNTPSDKLLAISNVARAFQRMLDDDEYVVGHWKTSLVESLGWQSLRCRPTGDSNAGDSNAPSWSWASFDGIPAMGYGCRSTHPTATIINTQVSLLDDAKPFGRVTTASIKLEAPLIPLKPFQKRDTIYVRTEKGDEEGFFPNFDTIDSRAASAQFLLDTVLFALVLGETHQGECSTEACDKQGTYRGLIVTTADDASGDRLRRIGFIVAPSSSFGRDELLDSRRTITLV